jgi:hypothetical protein
MEIIILLEEGMKFLLTPQNYNLLKNEKIKFNPKELLNL